MRKIIYHLRGQSEEVRRHILHSVTIFAGVVLMLLWIYSLGTTLNDPDIQAKTKNDLKPLSALKDNLIGGYKSISGSQ